MHRIHFSIVTPSFRSSQWLKLAIESVADQNVKAEHIIQDAGSDDGTFDLLEKDNRVLPFVEKDCGMYDGINRGLRKASGEILGYLNCDEQYLPGALIAVSKFFLENPTIEILFSHAIIVDAKGEFVCYRKAILPHKWHSLVSGNLSILTCATFFRRTLLQRGLFFDTQFRTAGDADWIVRCLDEKVPMAILDQFTSVFTETGQNLDLSPAASAEKQTLLRSAPVSVQALKPLIVAAHRGRKLAAGAYKQAPFRYAIYTRTNSEKRVEFVVEKPRARWRR